MALRLNLLTCAAALAAFAAAPAISQDAAVVDETVVASASTAMDATDAAIEAQVAEIAEAIEAAVEALFVENPEPTAVDIATVIEATLAKYDAALVVKQAAVARVASADGVDFRILAALALMPGYDQLPIAPGAAPGGGGTGGGLNTGGGFGGGGSPDYTGN